MSGASLVRGNPTDQPTKTSDFDRSKLKKIGWVAQHTIASFSSVAEIWRLNKFKQHLP
jgi:hypothetical protein